VGPKAGLHDVEKRFSKVSVLEYEGICDVMKIITIDIHRIWKTETNT
jgi:hypothetical protein